ncbi:hypothetical protein P154DRAFT_601909 [Amniculicola lignicola CBS 123094]|uniref:SMP-30/Gluconolactonase/LRE-like region domain-containing protein n=1 Tax=Amniculicola lignicola CBS 123094 TaxID=1392246 RepID=A0A6A5WCF4_9PLEO|nr:hypothetical protein P154DRAFT_601909 [Amniculicola lignicola CBS 123094]
MRFPTLLSLLSLTPSLGSTSPLSPRQVDSAQVYKFSGSPAWAEGIAARANGQLLVTFFDKGEIWGVNPSTKAASKLATFGNATCSAGIAEISPDVFAVVAGQFSFSGGNKVGSWGIWKVDLTGATATASLLNNVPEAGMFNGLTAFSNDTILIGDALKGAVYRMNVNTGEYSVAISDTATMAPPANAAIPMGIDGLRYANGTVWFTNVSKNTLHTVKVDATGNATSAIATVWSDMMADDLHVGPDGSAYIATGSNNKIQKVAPDGMVSAAATVSGSTAVTMGRTEADKNTLYIATSSGLIASAQL